MPSTIASERRPRSALSGRIRMAFVACLLGIGVAVSVPSPVAAWSANSYSPSDEQLLFNLTNQARASAGLSALRNDSYLVSAARWRSKDMIVRDYFSHNIPPTGEMVFAKMQRDGYCYQVAGENIGVSSYPDDVATTRIQNAFMNSPSHRSNILGVAWKNMGVGTYKGADGKKTWTVLFSQPCGAAPPATPKPTVRPTPKPTVRPTSIPTVRPTARPTTAPTVRPTAPSSGPTAAPATPSPTSTVPSPTASPTPAAPSERPTAEPTASQLPSPSTPGDTAEPSAASLPPAEPETAAVNLRVREAPQSEGFLDGLLRTLFGGILGL